MLSNFEYLQDTLLGRIRADKLQIELNSGGVRPIQSASNRAGPRAWKLEKNEIDQILVMDVNEPAQTYWVEPIVLAHEKEGKNHLCVDSRRLNAITFRESYPILRMDKGIVFLGESKNILTLDANNGYW